jgi:hypothetical protein
VPLGDEFDRDVGHLDGGLIVNRVPGTGTVAAHFRVRHPILRRILMIQVRKHGDPPGCKPASSTVFRSATKAGGRDQSIDHVLAAPEAQQHGETR